MSLRHIKLNKQQANHMHVGSCIVTLGYMLEPVAEIAEELQGEYPELVNALETFAVELAKATTKFNEVTEFTHEGEI